MTIDGGKGTVILLVHVRLFIFLPSTRRRRSVSFFFLTDGRCRVAINVLGRPTTEILRAIFSNRRNKLPIHVGKSIWWFR